MHLTVTNWTVHSESTQLRLFHYMEFNLKYSVSILCYDSGISCGLRYTKIMKLLIFLCHTHLAHYYGKKKNKRIGRPPGGHSNLACALKKASKRRKRRKNVFVHKKKRSSASVDNTPAGSPQVRDLWCTSNVFKPRDPCFTIQTERISAGLFKIESLANGRWFCGPGTDLCGISVTHLPLSSREVGVKMRRTQMKEMTIP